MCLTPKENVWPECKIHGRSHTGPGLGIGHFRYVLDQLEKYVAETIEPVVKFRKYRIFEYAAIPKFRSLLRSAMVGARGVNLLRKLFKSKPFQSS